MAMLMDLSDMLGKVYGLSDSFMYRGMIELLFGLTNRGIDLLSYSIGE